MSQSLVQIYLHIVFSTKDRRPLLHDPEIRDEMHRVLGGECNKLGCPVLCVGGITDHVHILCRLGRTTDVAELIKESKRTSSLWVKEKWPTMSEFHWQHGYGAFSLSPSHVEAVRDYIANQEEKYGLEWDERYVWD